MLKGAEFAEPSVMPDHLAVRALAEALLDFVASQRKAHGGFVSHGIILVLRGTYNWKARPSR